MAARKSRSNTRRTRVAVSGRRELTVSERLQQKLAAAHRKRLKARAQKGRRLSRTREFQDIAYRARLKTVRRYVRGLDAKKYQKRPERNDRAKVNRLYRKLQPYLSRSQKTVSVRTKRSEKALRRYAAFPKLKNLKAIPVATIKPDDTRVSVDRNGRVELKIGDRYREKLYLFPHAVRTPDDIEEMADDLVSHLPMGYYLIVTSHHDLLPTMAHRDQIMDELRMLIYQYRNETGFLNMIRGFKWLGHTREAAQRFGNRIDAARRNATNERRNAYDEIRKLARQKRREDTKRCKVRNSSGARCVLRLGHHDDHRFRYGVRRMPK